MYLCIAILGPTGSGKSDFAVEVAHKLNGEIVCLDSTTIYKGFDIGSSKPEKKARELIRHHLLDISEPTEPFSAHHFVELADEVISEIHSRKKTPVIVGGTYFYLRALQYGMYSLPNIPEEFVEAIEAEFMEEETLNTIRMHDELRAKDPKAAEQIHPNDRYRLVRALAIIRFTNGKVTDLAPQLTQSASERLWLKYAMTLPRHHLNQRIVLRTEQMINGGILQETETLRKSHPDAKPLRSIGYAECVEFLDKKITEKQLRNQIIEKTRQLAKRQTTWLRSDSEVRFVDTRDLPRIELDVNNLQSVIQTGI